MWKLADDLGLHVREARGPHVSGYQAGENFIRLTPGMRGRVLRSVLAHEIGHHVLGHLPTHLGPLRRRQERAANEWAALQLITPDAYATAEAEHGGHAKTMAVALNVADELVLVYQSLLTRIDSTVYVAPRMGTGQYVHRMETA